VATYPRQARAYPLDPQFGDFLKDTRTLNRMQGFMQKILSGSSNIA
jgi:hypothetical protein